MNRYLMSLITAAMLITLATLDAEAKTVVLEGKIASTIDVTQQVRFTVDKPLSSLSFRFALPTSFSNKAVTQETQNLSLSYSPKPEKEEDLQDRFGNRFHRVTWSNLTTDATATIQYRPTIKVGIQAMESRTPYPLGPVPDGEGLFLQDTKLVQSSADEFRSLVRKLTTGATTEYAAVSAILNHVADTIKYAYNPTKYDALTTMKDRSGNCQNLAHYSLALLRAAGIPARIVGGISLKEPWRVQLETGQNWVLTQGQGGHAWIEVYFPDLGWLSYDPLQSRQFTPTRHIKQTHGLDADDICDSWVPNPSYPAYNETITAKFLKDDIAVHQKSSLLVPKFYLLSNSMIGNVAGLVKPSLPSAKPLPLPMEPAVKPAPPITTGFVEFGNTTFPTLVDAYHMIGNEGRKTLDKETSEYVTSRQVYAQAFMVPAALRLDKVSLSMHKFGGDGFIYLDILADEDGKPGLEGWRSVPVPVESITRKPGYYWVDFTFPDDLKRNLTQGKYWIVLRHSGDAVMNWFYIPGKPYSGGEDTRSTAKGYKWEDILNFDFVFKVAGVVF